MEAVLFGTIVSAFGDAICAKVTARTSAVATMDLGVLRIAPRVGASNNALFGRRRGCRCLGGASDRRLGGISAVVIAVEAASKAAPLLVEAMRWGRLCRAPCHDEIEHARLGEGR